MTILPPLTPPVLLTHVPDGYDALLLSELANQEKQLVYVARDETRALRIKEQLSFFSPKLNPLHFPAWDCLPYDRASPHADIQAQRLNVLTFLAAPERPPFVIITTIQALLQKVPPKDVFEGRIWTVQAGQKVGHDDFIALLLKNGYVRRETVREWGEYAVRGGLIDLFPPGYDAPLRLDFFGDTVESLRSFDPLTQVSTGKVENLTLRPMGEINLTAESIEHFRKQYRSFFGAPRSDDPLYLAISEGRPYGGFEHWLPLFYESLTTFMEYAGGAVYCFDDHLDEARQAHLDEIQDHYQTRKDFEALEAEGAPYHPLPPEELYLLEEDWDKAIPETKKIILTPFSPPDFKGTIIDMKGKVAPSFSDARHGKENVFERVKASLETFKREGKRILLVGATEGSGERLAHILEEHQFPSFKRVCSFPEFLKDPEPSLAILEMDHGFEAENLVVLTEEDILGERIGRPVKSKKRSDLFIQEVSSLQLGDLVVHVEHGIGRYEGLKTLVVDHVSHDFLELEYADKNKLYVPVENIEVLSRYGAADAQAMLDRLGGAAWQARKARVKKRLREVADYLLKIAAARKLQPGEIIERQEGIYDEFAARFPYPETDDQLTAISDVLEDLRQGQPMDRLICGDVGFGKTEVAMRAALVVAATGKQVALIVPTTLLARQHYQSFKARFENTGIRVAQLSRLVKAKEASKIKDELARGEIQILIGTHALLAKSVEFRDLGLLIVDEEQHFGVAQKEKLKNLKANIHVLTLTATPIPRTLQMALAGVRELSLITTPPLDRMAVRTFVLPFDAMVMREALLREQFRGGQSFYVCPRISDLEKVAEKLRHFVPEVKFLMAHGQMTPTALENVMTEFYEGGFDVLLSTNIIESGIDIARANTLLIHRADLFGLAQLYQLRGRIGRSKVRGYAYLTYAPGKVLSSEAQKRLEVIQSLDSLGAGFSLASHDMDIRGAGNLVGEEQSGHIREVGVELYQHMLEEAISSLKAEGMGETYISPEWTPQINLGVSVLIPESYVADLGLRLSLYKRLSDLATREEIDQFAVELVDRFGTLPEEVKNLLEVIYLKALARQANVDKLEVGPKGILIGFYQDTFSRPEQLIEHITAQKGTAKIRPDQKIFYSRVLNAPASKLSQAQQILEGLVELSN